MKNVSVYFVVIVLSLLASIPSRCQVQSPETTPSRLIIDVATGSKKGVFLFATGGQQIPDNDLLGFLNKHWDDKSERTIPIVMIPPSLTLLEIGSIEATFSKAGYHKVRFFVYAKNSGLVEELTFNEPVPAESVRGPNRPKM